MTKLVYLKSDNVNVAIGNGKNLAVSPVQGDSLRNNFATKLSEYEQSLNTLSFVPNDNLPNDVSPMDLLNGMNNTPIDNTIISNVSDTPNVIEEVSQAVTPIIPTVENNAPAAEPSIISPFTNDTPSLESILNQNTTFTPEPTVNVMNEVPAVSIVETPVVETVVTAPVTPVENPNVGIMPTVEPPVVGNLEIVSESKETEFDLMQREIDKATKEYQERLAVIFETYKLKIESAIKEANDFKAQAQEHLKNAQAAETIAEIARQNANNITTDSSDSNSVI